MTKEPRFPGLAAVSGVIAVFDPQRGIDAPTRQRLARAGDGRPVQSGPLAVASRGLDAHAWWSDGHLMCVLDGRLHDRESLISTLGLTPAASDPEIAATALSRWGAMAPGRLRGTYACITWSSDQQRGWVVQDHLGGRSLYVMRQASRWIVASELRLLLEAATTRPAPDAEGIIQWLGGGAMREGQMLHRGVRRFAGGHSCRLSPGPVQLEPYWTPRYEGELDVTRDEAAQVIRNALRTAIRRHVRRDERVGTLLSGGIDSTAVAAGMVHWCRDLGGENTAYSMVMPDDDREDESHYVDIATRELGLPGWRVIPSGDGALWHALWYQDAFALPLLTPGTVLDWHLVRMAAEDGASAMFDGQGGDEVFGHDRYLLADLARRGRWAQAWRLLHASPYSGAQPASWQLRSMLRSYAFRGNTPRWYDLARPDEQEITATCLRGDLAARHRDRVDPFPWKQRDGPRWWAHQASMMTELRDVYWVFDLLRRRGGLEGIEIRSPLLDVDLAETVLRMPPRYAFDAELDRPLLRQALRDVLPEPIVTRRRKSNYSRANHNWLVRLVPAFTALVGAPNAEIGEYVDRAAVDRLLRAIPGDTDPDFASWGPQLWTLASAELWLRAEAGRDDEIRAIVASTPMPNESPVASPWRPARRGQAR